MLSYQIAFKVALSVMAPAFAIGVMLISLAYMLGKLLQKEDWIAWAKTEIVELIVVSIIPFSVAFLSLIASQVVSQIDYKGSTIYCQGNIPECHIVVAGSYFENMLREVLTLYQGLVKLTLIPKMLEGASVELTHRATITESAGNVFAMLTPFNIIVRKFCDFLRISAAIVAFQYFFVALIVQIFPHLLFLGLVLRVLPFTRKLGGLILAIALVFYYFYPVLVSLLDAVYWQLPKNPDTEGRINRLSLAGIKVKVPVKGPGGDIIYQDIDISKVTSKNIDYTEFGKKEKEVREEAKKVSNAGSKAWEFFKKNVLGWLKNMVVGFMAWVWNVIKFGTVTLALVMGTPLISASTFLWGPPFLDGVMSMIADVVVMNVLMAWIILIACIGAVKSLSPVLGGDTEIGGLSHLI